MNDVAGSVPSPVRLRPVLEKVPAYVAGKPAGDLPGVVTYKLSSNENPYPPLPGVLDVIQQAAQVNRYPDMNNIDLKAAIARFVDLPATWVTVGPGSVGVLGQIIQAVCDPGDEVIFAWRSFEAYPILTTVTGAHAVTVPLTATYEHDLEAMAAAVTDRTRLILLCTPNNPTGTVLTDAGVRGFLARVPAQVGVVIDEAYVEFVRDDQAPNSLALLRDYPNVIVLRTFSKAYGLAGLRVGYALAHPKLTEAFAKTAIPFGVNSIAQSAAIHSLDVHDELMARVHALVAERERVVATLAAQGWHLPATQANFVYFPLGKDECGSFTAACDAVGLVVRRYGDDGVRVTIGEPEANDRLLRLTATLTSALRDPSS